MQIQPPTIAGTIPLTSVIRGSLGTDRVSLPVPRSQLVYARFKHISGRPGPSGEGYPLAKLRGLDNLIDRLVKLKDSKAQQLSSEMTVQSVPDESVDALIHDLSSRLHRAYLKAETNPFMSLEAGSGVVANMLL